MPFSSLPPCVRSHDTQREKGPSRAWNERFYGLLPSPVCKFVFKGERERESEWVRESRNARVRLLGTVWWLTSCETMKSNIPSSSLYFMFPFFQRKIIYVIRKLLEFLEMHRNESIGFLYKIKNYWPKIRDRFLFLLLSTDSRVGLRFEKTAKPQSDRKLMKHSRDLHFAKTYQVVKNYQATFVILLQSTFYCLSYSLSIKF